MAGTYYRPSACRGSGAGVLGRRIATSWVAAGYNITIRDPNADQRNGALQFINNNIANFAEVLGDTNPRRGQFAAFEGLDTAVKNAWFVVEAVPEKLNLKISTFGDLARKAPKDCIIGSNSSSFKSRLMLADMDVESKKRALNVHCTMPPGSRIVELMTSTHTYDEIFPFLVQKHKEIGLLPAVALRESTGFIINRLLGRREKEDYVNSRRGSGDVRVENGSLRWMDADGLDTVAFIEDNYIQERGLSGKNTADWLRKNYVNEGKLGAKSGHGGLYLAGYATKPATQEPGHHDNLAAPTFEGRIFWTNMGIRSENNGSVQSSNLDGSDIKTISSQLGQCIRQSNYALIMLIRSCISATTRDCGSTVSTSMEANMIS
ncbi:hypothetical protein ETB97_003812 [Aspergillus alliaceus]|uniref:3-hydroxyacyl-CoA dehydrogenase NAD binding domain-containing protein n=1 Tax=Petromyces alliaceus TaxID=209559 RepID=A0A8H5ZXH5_PETAA|nr:hypothetical protein ETB97_003812 [Aspergillus burnettii]